MRISAEVLLLVLWLPSACVNSDQPTSREDDAVKARGVLSGVLVRGPLCPVVSPAFQCPPSEAARDVPLSIQREGENSSLTVSSGANGRYRIELAPGIYQVTLATTGMEFSKQLPARVVITAGSETVLNINIDSGIR
jgi:hypothetical protein